MKTQNSNYVTPERKLSPMEIFAMRHGILFMQMDSNLSDEEARKCIETSHRICNEASSLAIRNGFIK